MASRKMIEIARIETFLKPNQIFKFFELTEAIKGRKNRGAYAPFPNLLVYRQDSSPCEPPAVNQTAGLPYFWPYFSHLRPIFQA